VFWLRIVVPRDLHQRVGRREWRFSLRTREPLIARLRCLETTLAVARLHTIIRSMRTLTDTQIADIAKAYLAWALKHAVDGAQTMAAGPLVAELDGEAMELRSVQQLDDGAPENERKALIEALNRKRADLVVQKQGWAAKHLAAEFSNTQGSTSLALMLRAKPPCSTLSAALRSKNTGSGWPRWKATMPKPLPATRCSTASHCRCKWIGAQRRSLPLKDRRSAR